MSLERLVKGMPILWAEQRKSFDCFRSLDSTRQFLVDSPVYPGMVALGRLLICACNLREPPAT